MPYQKRSGNCWSVKTKLERVLIVVLVTNAVCLGLILIFFLAYYQNTPPSHPWSQATPSFICRTHTCIKETSQILTTIDTTTNPCENFYDFACKPSNYHEEPFERLQQKEKWQLQLLYNQPIEESEHDLVKIQKAFYGSCMNKTLGVKDSVKIVMDVLRELGGWPVVVGYYWNEVHFDWLNTTYKLRQLGYNFGMFLNVEVIPDPMIIIPEVRDVWSEFFDSDETNGFMMDVAVAFGAELHRALPEMTETLQFLQDLQWLQKRDLFPQNRKPRRTTIQQFQQEYGKINWLSFIKRTAGPSVEVDEKDFVMFPSELELDDWFELLLRTSKRTQANYMLWRVVEQTLPYLTEELHNRGVKPRLVSERPTETHSEFCLKVIESRFIPSPMYLMYLRKHLGDDKRRKIEEVLVNIKAEVLETVERMEWKDGELKRNALDKVNDMVVVVGAPESYFGEGIFEEMQNVYEFQDVSSNTNFLNLLSQANKNNWKQSYSLINNPTTQTHTWWYLNKLLSSPNDQDEQILNIPAYVLENVVFNPRRQNYFNFGSLGIILGPRVTKLLGIPSVSYEDAVVSEEWASYLECMAYEMNSTEIDELFPKIFGLKIAYRAYTTWIKSQEHDEKSVLVDFTPNQLFWISSTRFFCNYKTPTYVSQLQQTRNTELHALILTKILNTDRDVRNDFKCPELQTVGSNCKLL